MKKKLFCLLLSLATCACLAFGAAGCEKNTADSGQNTEQSGNNQNSGSQSGTQSSADAPVYLGMSIASSSERYFLPFGGAISKDARDNDDHDDDDDDDDDHDDDDDDDDDHDDHDDDDDDDDRPHNGNGGTQSGSGNSNDKWSPDVDGGVYRTRPNSRIKITIHFTNPKQYEIISFTLNEKKYAVNMFEKGSDLENIILDVSVGEFERVTDYTIDAIKYIDGETIKDVRIGGDKTVKLYRTYEIDYHDEYGADLPEEYTILSDTIALSAPSRKGYTFEGWFEDAAYTKPIEKIEKGSEGDRDVYAKWSVIDYTITYHLDGGTNGENPESYTVEDRVVLQKAEKAGYTFEGWYEDDAFTKRASFENATGDKQLYAKWKLSGYPINYHLNGGENSSENPLSYTVDDAIEFKQAEKRGYTFEGWFEDEACTKQIERIEKGSEGEIDLYAKWEIVTYNIEYVSDGGTGAENPASYTVEDKIELANPTKKDNYFLGWYKDEEHKELVTELENMTGNLKLYAWWIKGTEGLSFKEIEEGKYGVSDYEGESKIVVIPDKYFGGFPVVAVWWSAFQNCKSITSVTIPSGVTSIENSAFHGCSSLEEITLPEGVTTIGESAFYECKALESITIPSGVTSIGRNAFYGCEELVSIAIPEGVTTIGGYAFWGCSSLQSIVIPQSVTSIGDSAFHECKALESIEIPDGVTKIGEAAFAFCTSLREVIIPKGVTAIENHTFYCCNALEKITIPDRITSIGDSAFSECFALEDVVIPNGVTSIGDEAFRYCEKLDSIIIPDSVTEIGDRAFYICPSLKSILIGKGVKRIGENVFYSTALTEIRYNGTAEEWGKIKLNKNWAKDSSITKIICADGTVIKLDEE